MKADSTRKTPARNSAVQLYQQQQITTTLSTVYLFHHHRPNRLKSTAGHKSKSFVGSSKIHGPAPPSDSFDVVCPPSWGPTYAAFTGAGSPFQHLGTPTSIGSPSYVSPPISTSALRRAELCR
ncbi:jg12953 [Pararge aegeria aegeria]|uniref:Jg12953 protein n=1 Tax=Pararge aegeria aegeria TaxID=348720 RepID=A0A8S4QQN6_9NEOP|nr:jg12953 [Pararge aegeria aegeria]